MRERARTGKIWKVLTTGTKNKIINKDDKGEVYEELPQRYDIRSSADKAQDRYTPR